MFYAYYSKSVNNFRKIIVRVCLLFVSINLFTLLSATLNAQGNLLVTPKRLVFDGTKRAQELNLVNVGQDTVTYSVSFVQNRMKEDGAFEKIEQPDPGQFFADKHLRFFPRSVTLAPGEVQTVKVQITKSDELTDGEYRSHLYFRAEPKDQPSNNTDRAKDSGISVRIVPVFGISVPTIIRKGDNTSAIQFSNVSFDMEKDSIPVLSLTIDRIGNMSVYGDISVDHIASSGKVSRVGTIKGLSVYTPNNFRRVQVVLDKSLPVNYHSGSLHVVYSDPLTKRIAQREIGLN